MQDRLKPDSGRLIWRWDSKEIPIGYDRMGTGPSLLLLPAPSSISTRGEMLPLQQRLAPYFSTVAIDWPGFGDLPRPPIMWSPEAYTAFLRYVLADVVTSPVAIVAAGHAATYALACADASPEAGLCLIAPTWRGPLPTVMDGKRRLGKRVARLSDLPGLGPVLYRLNVNAPMVRMMAKGHVYQSADWLTEARLAQKMAVTRMPGARYASIRFVTGLLDLVTDRASFLDLAKRVKAPLLVVYGAATPRRSKAEMEALASIPGVRAVELTVGKLAIHEEFPDAVAEPILAFLKDRTPAPSAD